MGKGGSSQPVKSTTDTAPWGEQQPYLKEVFTEAQKQYQTGGPQLMPGSGIAPMSGPEKYASTYLSNLAQGPLEQQAKDLATAQKFGLGDVLSPDSNAYLKDYANASTKGIWDNLNNNVLGQTRSAANAAGQFGGSRQGIAEGLATKSAIEADADTRSKIYSNAYGQGLDVFKSTMAQVPQNMVAQQMPATVMAGVGSQERAFEQAMLDEQIARWNYEQNLPFTNLAQYQNLIQGNYGGTSTSDQMRASQGSGTMQSLLGVGMLAASMMMSDMRVKRDMRKCGMTLSGIPVYEYRYFGSKTLYRGVLAQDVEALFPHAVKMVDGLLMVDYTKINLEKVYAIH